MTCTRKLTSVKWAPSNNETTEDKKMKNAITKIWAKKETQTTLAALRRHGYQVEKINSGYCVTHPNGTQVLKAMNGNNGYLVRYDERLFKS